MIALKIVQINSVCKPGSVGKIATEIYKTLLSENEQGSIAYGRGSAPTDIDSYKFANNIEVYFHVLMNRVTDRHGLYSKVSTHRLIKYLENERPDIIHLHGIHGYYLNYKILFDYLKETEIPIVWTLHDCWPITGHCAFFDLVKCDKWKKQCYECPNIKEYPRSIRDNSRNNYCIKKKTFSSINNLTIVTPSIWLKDILKHSFLANYDTRVINNGIDLKFFHPQIELKSTMELYSKYDNNVDFSKVKVILGVANIWSKRKGLDDFIKLSKMLGDTYRIFLVGLSKKQIELLPPNMSGIMRTDSTEELALLYKGAFCFLNLTYEDNYPTVNLEALACGTPVITYNTGGSGEMIADPECVVEQGDLIKIVSLLEKHTFSVNPNLSDLDASERFKEYLSLYREILNCKGEQNE